ncbi:MAG: hypothetical protein ACLUEK_09365 [Oscillospiraceae bacterium]
MRTCPARSIRCPYAPRTATAPDYGMVSRLVKLAADNGVDCAVDIYPHHGPDVAAAWRQAWIARAALIGPGVHASHGMERTHLDALRATLKLAGLYLELE